MHGSVCEEICLLAKNMIGSTGVGNPNMRCIYLDWMSGFRGGCTFLLNVWEVRSARHIRLTGSADVQFKSGFTMVT
jgi:hypothetical protein